jgi:hypothetical protein
MAKLIVESGLGKGTVLELQAGVNTLGRAVGNDFVLEDLAVSGRHCEIVVSEISAKVRDLGSSNGTYVNGRQVTEAALLDGHTLSLGQLTMRFRLGQVDIAIPDLPPPEIVEPPPLADGSPACRTHHNVPAAYACTQCSHLYCGECVKELRLVGGKSRVFCPSCSGACRLLQAAAKAKPKSVMATVWETIRIPFRKPPSSRK